MIERDDLGMGMGADREGERGLVRGVNDRGWIASESPCRPMCPKPPFILKPSGYNPAWADSARVSGVDEYWGCTVGGCAGHEIHSSLYILLVPPVVRICSMESG